MTTPPEMFIRLSRSKQQKQSIKLLDTPLALQGDLKRLRTAFQNILHNAIIYTPDGGNINIEIGTYTDVRQRQFGIITVEDNGVGIPQENIPHLFEPFYKVNQARTSDGTRSGMGLAITKTIVDLHHGVISIESEPDKGSCFQILLPLST